ncbi:unnamed protein product [Lactuca virosa]|uniref:Uncharacterized protein n=1 Tax=Lactuca virosa TaxID=75947 RepID=A0AAU9PPK5_9ASTR|nr:unnamed protein product [Lactuca virosa]
MNQNNLYLYPIFSRTIVSIHFSVFLVFIGFISNFSNSCLSSKTKSAINRAHTSFNSGRQLECANLTTKTTQNSETSLSGFREKMSTGNCRRISPEEVQKVQNLIEQCLWNYMNKKQAMDILYQKQNIEPIFTKLVWERLEEENQEFFKIYYLKLALTNQITQFNDLLLINKL